MLHLWTAERFCKIYGITDNDTLHGIFVGTEFPDIRYISHQPRSITHPAVREIQEVCESRTPFEAGMKLHAWLDLIREDFISQEIYDSTSPYAEGFSVTLLKFIEEEILSDFYDGRVWSSYFNKVLPEELAFADEGVVLKWHGMIQWTMNLKPSWLLYAQSFRGPAFGVPVSTLYTWSYLLPELKKKMVFEHHLHSLLVHIESELQKHSDELSTAFK